MFRSVFRSVLRFASWTTLVLVGPASLMAGDVNPQPSTPNSGWTTHIPRPQTPPPVHPEGDLVGILNVETKTTYASIQDAVLGAAPGDTLEVQDLTHLEGAVVIDRDLTLRGATGDEVIVASADTGDSGDARAWFLVESGADVQVRDLGFDGSGFRIHQAFRHRGSGSFDNVRFRGIQFDASGPSYAGSAIVAFGGPVDVRDSVFEQIGRQGIFLFGVGVNGSVVERNTYFGKGVGDYLDYGIEVGGGADVVIRENTIAHCRGEASADGSGSAAILVSTLFGAGTTATVDRNVLVDSTVGLLVGLTGSGETSTVNASFNRIVDNDSGVQSSSSVPVTAENNWWGCNDGPSLGLCDAVTGGGPVDADPHLVLSLTTSATSLAVGETAIMQAELFRNSDGVDVSSLGALPDGTEATFDGGALGVFAPPLATTTGGLATSVWTATDPGNDVVRTIVDGQEVLLPVSVGGSTPLLFVREEIAGVGGLPVVVPVEFGGAGLDIAAVAFSVDFDETCLAFDASDNDLDGLPDAIEFVAPAAFIPTVFVDLADTDGELDIILADVPPLTGLPDGVLANVTFDILCTPSSGTVLAPVGFSTDPAASFGNVLGQDVPGTSTDGSVLILSGLRGDCNGDGFISAGDIAACGLEAFDGDGNFWLDVAGGTFTGNPVGCDANADTLVDAGDVACKGRLIFGQTCDAGGSTLETIETLPRWSLPWALSVVDDRVDVAVDLATAGQALSATIFSLHLDRQRVAFDETDEDGDGLPDAVHFGGAAAIVSVFLDPADDATLHVLIADLSPSPALLEDGDRLSISLQPLAGVTDVDGAVRFKAAPPVSFGSPQGRSVPGHGDVAGGDVFRDGFESGDTGAWSNVR